MSNAQAEWVFNFILRLGVVVALSALALGLILGVGPLTALLRSGTAFLAFAMLGWASARLWEVPALEAQPVEAAARPEAEAAAGSQPADDEE